MAQITHDPLLTSLAKQAEYARVINITGFRKAYHAREAKHYNQIGRIESKGVYIGSNHPNQFSVNLWFRPPGDPSPTSQVHEWVYPYLGDNVKFYDAQGYYLGYWDGKKVWNTPHGSAGEKTRGRLPQEVRDCVFTTEEEGAKLFTATTVKAKGGFRAQVTYNTSGKVVWESTEVYADDDNFQAEDYDDGVRGQGKSGQTKAQEAAASVVDKVVEGLFDNVQV